VYLILNLALFIYIYILKKKILGIISRDVYSHMHDLNICELILLQKFVMLDRIFAKYLTGFDEFHAWSLLYLKLLS
jgi:hypothetical protein